MKLINKYLTLLLSLSLFTACDFMDCDESDNYSLEQIEESYARVKQFVTNVYSYLPSNFCNLDGAMQDAATDDAIHVYESSDIQRFVNGTWSANYTVDDKYAHYYNGIHDANFFLENLTNLKFEDWQYGDDYENWMKEYANFEYEVRFLRAFFYFELVKRYQNVPLIEKVLTLQEANNVEQASSDVIFKFIISECTEAAKVLPATYAGYKEKETGRITKGAALALKARAALYAASRLFNPNGDKDKWIAAAEAAYEIIGDQTALGYGLDKSFSNLFGPENNKSKEVILARPTGSNNSFEAANFPMGVKGGKTSTCPTENLASAFEMKTGVPFDWNDENMRKNPYEKRDPRFYMTIVHNNMKWPADKNVEIWEGGVNGLPLPNATSTGYYLCKYVNKSISFEPGAPTANAHHNWVLFRYAEVLLNYAEAVCESGLGDKTIAAKALNDIRKRAAHTNEIELTRENVRNERFVELAFENIRIWDLRRWRVLHTLMNNFSHDILVPMLDLRDTNPSLIFVRKTTMGASLNGPNSYSISEYYEDVPRNAINQMIQNP